MPLIILGAMHDDNYTYARLTFHLHCTTPTCFHFFARFKAHPTSLWAVASHPIGQVPLAEQ